MTEENKYKEFFLSVWDDYCEHNFDLEAGETILRRGIKLGLIKEEEYDPEIHPENLSQDWDLAKGDTCYVLATI